MRIRQLILSAFAFLIIMSCQKVPTNKPFIAVNLVGYNSNDFKQAMPVNADALEYEIVDTENSNVVYEGRITQSFFPDFSTGDTTSLIDFSDFGSQGYFMIRLKEQPEVKSEQFAIGQNVYKSVALTAIQSFYYARCGTAIDNGTPWKHAVCHINDGVFYRDPSRYKDVTGGWHDAGDYNKFSVNTIVSVGLLLSLYETRSELFTDGQLNIPESENGVPDLLDEIRWALEWLMKLQDYRGGIYHKVSQKKWVGEFLPHEDPETRYIFEVSSNATGGFAAVAAYGARLFKPYDQAFAGKLARAANEAWRYLDNHPVTQPLGGFKNPPDVVGGEYGDYQDIDVRLWASIELYKLTGDLFYLEYFKTVYEKIDIVTLQPLSWKEFSSFALFSFLEADLPPGYEFHKNNILSQLKNRAEVILKSYEKSNYKTLLSHKEYYWGSNSVALGYGYLFTRLYLQTGNEKYYRAAMDQLHYNLGRNPFNKSFVTGVGTNAVRHPYHQFSMELDYGKPVPGMLVGGPNNYVFLNGREISEYPGKNYEDSEKNYYVNEVAINWTAVLAYTAGFFSQNDKLNNEEIISTKIGLRR